MKFSDKSFSYDGTFEGFLCAVVRCISMRIVPRDIKAVGAIHALPDDYLFVRTDRSVADRMYRYIGSCSSVNVQQLALDCFLTGLPCREKDLYILICRAIRFGAPVGEDYSNPVMQRIHNAVRELYREAQSIMCDLAFEREGRLAVADICPKNRVLPIMRLKVLDDPALQDFLLYDDRHKMLFMRSGQVDRIVDISCVDLSAEEQSAASRAERYRRLWTYFSRGEHIKSMDKLDYKGADRLSPMWYMAV